MIHECANVKGKFRRIILIILAVVWLLGEPRLLIHSCVCLFCIYGSSSFDVMIGKHMLNS